MRLGYVSSALSLILTDFGIVTFIPALVAVFYKDYNSIAPFLVAGIVALIIGLTMKRYTNKKSSLDSLNDIKRSEALVTVSLAWILVGCVASIPYLFYNFSISLMAAFTIARYHFFPRKVRNNTK